MTLHWALPISLSPVSLTVHLQSPYQAFKLSLWGLLDGRWIGFHVVQLIVGCVSLHHVELILDSGDPGRKSQGLMTAVITRSKTKHIFVLYTQLFWTGEQWSEGWDSLSLRTQWEAPDRGTSVPPGWWAVAQGCTVGQRLPSPAPHRLQQVCLGLSSVIVSLKSSNGEGKKPITSKPCWGIKKGTLGVI